MRKKWLIDGHNVWHKTPGAGAGSPADYLGALAAFCEQIQKKCVAEKRRATIVFDGHPNKIPGNYPQVNIRFSGSRTADEVILSILRNEQNPEKWIVVSDDREVRDGAGRYRADILRTDGFLTEKKKRKKPTSVKKPAHPPEPNIDGHELEMWKNLFGVDGDNGPDSKQ